MKKSFLIAAASVAAMSLAACGSNEPEPAPVQDEVKVAEDANNNTYPVAGELNAEQQANLSEMDSAAVATEYEKNREAILAEADGGATTGTDAAATGPDTPVAAESGNPALPPRGEMTFGFLDRDGDGELSVAEYAVWALPTDPNDFAANDAKKPFLSSDQIDTAAQTFFFFDTDQDGLLSPGEFTQARRSGEPA